MIYRIDRKHQKKIIYKILFLTLLKMTASILDKYQAKEIEQAKRELIRKGLCDDEIQATRNLEMDLEERHQLATGGRD